MTEPVSQMAPVARSGTPAFALAAAGLGLLAALLALGWLWRIESRNGALQKERGEHAAEQRLIQVRLKQVETELRVIQLSVQDAAAINRSLRDEVLGVAERAELVEQALKRVSDRGMENVSELRMNNAEFLLGAGLARLRLFQDIAGAATALSLADAELSALRDPVVTGIRQSLARELAALSGFPADTRVLALARLQRIAEKSDKLILRRETLTAAPLTDIGWSARARRLLGEFVRVRRIRPGEGSFAEPLSEALARVDLRLQLRYAEAALMEADSARFKAQLLRIQSATQAFDLKTETGQWLVAELKSLAELPAFPEFAEAGGALQQLRNLQGTRQLAQPFGGVE